MEHLPRRVPAGDINLLDYLVPMLQEFVGDVPILGDLIEILSGVEDGTVDDVGSWVNNLVANLTGLGKNTNRAIMEIQAKLAEGAKFSDTFDRADNHTSLGNGWIQGGEGEGLGIIDNAARLDNRDGVLASTGRRYAICPQTADDDDCTVAAGVNNAGVAIDAMTSLFIRSNSSLTEFVFANIYGKSVYMGRGTRSGNTWSFTDWTSKTSGINIPEGALIELQADGADYSLSVNGSTLLSHTDVSGYPIDASHRTVGFASETRTSGLGGLLRSFSWGLVAFTMRSTVVLTAIDSAFSNAAAAVTAANDASDAADTAVVAATDATDTAVGVANTVNEYISGDEAAGVDGQSYYASFPGPDIDPIWVTTTPGEVSINGGALGINSSGSEGTFAYRFNAAVDTDDMAVKCVLTSAGVDYANDAHTTLYARLASGGGSFVYCKLFKDRIEIGKGSGAFLTFDTPWATKTITLKAGYTIEFRMVGNDYSVRINGTQVLAATNATATVGASNRYGGVAFSRNNVPPFGYLASARISSWSLLDLSGTEVNGTCWTMFRASTSAINFPGSGYQIAPSGTFDTFPSAIINNVQIFTASGQVVIQKAGPYSITVGFDTAAGVADEGVDRIPCLFKAGDIMSPFALFRIGQASTDIRPIACTWTEYLEVGQVLVPGLSAGVRDQVTGDTLGTKTFFTGALVANPVGRKGDKGDKGDQGDQGIQGVPGPGLALEGTVATYGALPALTLGDAGKQYLVSGENRAYLWLGNAWHATAGNGIQLKGDTGTPGTSVTISRVTSLPASGTTGVIYWIPV